MYILQVFYYSTNLFITTGLSESHAKYATIGIGTVMVVMTLISIPLMDKSGRRTLHLYGLGGMFIFSIFITISFLVKVKEKSSDDSKTRIFLFDTGNSSMDLVAVSGLDTFLRSFFCCWSWFNSMDDYSRTIFSRTKTSSYVDCCLNKLVCKLLSRNWIPNNAGENF